MGAYKQKFNPISGQFNLVSTAVIMTFRDAVATESALPPTGNVEGDARFTTDTGHLYVWDGTQWVDQGDVIDYPSGGTSIIQDATAVLDPDETKTITHASDPLFKRIIEILIQLQQSFSYQFSDPYESNYDYDANKVKFWPMGWDYVTLANTYGAEGMVAYYIFNDDSVEDVYGSHDATNFNCTFMDGIVERELVLNGTNAYMDIPNHSDFYIVDPVSNSIGFEFWINASSDGEIISLWNEDNNRRSWRIYVQSGYVCMDVSVDGVNTTATSQGSYIGHGYWQHVGIYLNDYYGGLYWKMYVGGSSLMIPGFSPTFSYPLFQNTIDPIRVGAKGGTAANFINATLCELAIYRNYDLTQPMGMHSSVFQAHYNTNMMGNHLSQYSTDMQNIKTNSSGQIDTSDWLGIQYASFYGNYYGDYEVTALFSVDGRASWKKWDGSAWQTVLETEQGTSTAMLPITRAEWDLLFVPGTLDYILQLKTNNSSGTPEIYSLTIGAYKPGYMPSGWKANFSCISDTETQIRNCTNDQAAPETLHDIKTNIIL